MGRTLSWERVGGHFFQTLDFVAMRWDVRVGHNHIRAAPCGGVIAVWDREDAVVRRDAGFSTRKKQLTLYGSEGSQLGKIDLDFGPVADVQILQDETVIIATKPGLLRYYTEFGKNFLQLHIHHGIEALLLSNDDCVAQLTSGSLTDNSDEGPFRLASVVQYSESELRHRVLELGTRLNSPVRGWHTLRKNSEVGQAAGIILVDASGQVHLFDSDLTASSHRVVADQVPVGLVSASPDNLSIAFSDGGKNITVYPSDFHEVLLQTSSANSHKSLWWIGSDAIALYTGAGEADILSLRPGTSAPPATTYFEDDEVAFIPEIDGLRILGAKNHGMLVSVLPPTEEIFKLGSLTPSAVLYSCVDQLDAGSPRPDQTVKLFEPRQLSKAVDTCIGAALLELEPKAQKRLLRAALFGKSMLEAYDSSRYLAALTRLRILNSLRSLTTCPFFVTNRELEELGIARLLHRLELRGFWTEAVSIAQLTHVPVEPIYIEWACSLIQSEDKSDDTELLTQIDTRMGKLTTYSRTKMALRAMEKGRQDLAFKLLENEPVANDRVMLLLEMNSAQSALEQAVQSGDPYLVDYALMILTEQLPLPQLMRVIGGDPVAVERKVQLARLNTDSRDQLHEFLYHMDLRQRSLELEFEDISETGDPLSKERMIRALESKFSGLNKRAQPESRACGNWADLLSIQRQLETDVGIEIVGKSASDTISALLKISQLSQAQKLRTKLGISDREFWWLRLRALVDKRDFVGVWDFGQSKKSPIGYQPFFNACFEAGSMDYAARFVDMISEASVESKIHMYIKTRHVEKAKELLPKLKSPSPEILKLLDA